MTKTIAYISMPVVFADIHKGKYDQRHTSTRSASPVNSRFHVRV